MKRIFLLMGTLLLLASGACGYFLYQNQQLYHHSLEQADEAIAKKDYRNAAIHVERALFIKKSSKEALAYKEQLEPAMTLSDESNLDLTFISLQSKKILQIPQGSAELKAQARAWQDEVARLTEEKAELEILNKADEQATHLSEICEQRNTLALEFEILITKQKEQLQKEVNKAKELLTVGNYQEATAIITPIIAKEAKAFADIQLEAKKLFGIIQQSEKIEQAM